MTPTFARTLASPISVLTGILMLAIATSAAGAEGAFGFQDATLDTMPPAHAAFADLARGTLTLEGDALRATIELAALPEMTAGMVYVFLFSDGTNEHFVAAVTQPGLSFLYGKWLSDDEGPVGSHDADGTYATGAPGRIEIDMPRSALGAATLLTAPRAFTADIKGGAPGVGLVGPDLVIVDEATGEGELALPPDPSAPEGSADPTAEASSEPAEASAEPASDADETPAGPQPASSVPGFGASIALASVAGALLGAHRRSR